MTERLERCPSLAAQLMMLTRLAKELTISLACVSICATAAGQSPAHDSSADGPTVDSELADPSVGEHPPSSVGGPSRQASACEVCVGVRVGALMRVLELGNLPPSESRDAVVQSAPWLMSVGMEVGFPVAPWIALSVGGDATYQSLDAGLHTNSGSGYYVGSVTALSLLPMAGVTVRFGRTRAFFVKHELIFGFATVSGKFDRAPGTTRSPELPRQQDYRALSIQYGGRVRLGMFLGEKNLWYGSIVTDFQLGAVSQLVAGLAVGRIF